MMIMMMTIIIILFDLIYVGK